MYCFQVLVFVIILQLLELHLFSLLLAGNIHTSPKTVDHPLCSVYAKLIKFVCFFIQFLIFRMQLPETGTWQTIQSALSSTFHRVQPDSSSFSSVAYKEVKIKIASIYSGSSAIACLKKFPLLSLYPISRKFYLQINNILFQIHLVRYHLQLLLDASSLFSSIALASASSM